MPAGKVGRPARIDRTAIAEAVLDIGLDGISMKAVADHLGVSVAGLYHHVANRRELLVLAAEYSLSRIAAPEDTGQHWDEWLREWARHVYRSFVEEPEILVQYMNGGLRWDAMGEFIDSVIQVLGRAGFDPVEAISAFDTLAQCAIGAAVHEIRQRAAAEAGRSLLAELHRTVAGRPADQLVGLRALLDLPPIRTAPDFEDQLTTVLVGVAVRRGEDWRPVAERGSHTSASADTGPAPRRPDSLTA